jgi:hypothetical protein|tara:strand:+ start:4142 stop:4303 length:162 start_codon:yes stop_codon:yes gene_type:complete
METLVFPNYLCFALLLVFDLACRARGDLDCSGVIGADSYGMRYRFYDSLVGAM